MENIQEILIPGNAVRIVGPNNFPTIGIWEWSSFRTANVHNWFLWRWLKQWLYKFLELQISESNQHYSISSRLMKNIFQNMIAHSSLWKLEP